MVELIRAARTRQHTANVFTHTVAAPSILSDLLVRNGIAHEQVGLSEAHAEAFAAQRALLRHGLCRIYLVTDIRVGGIPEDL